MPPRYLIALLLLLALIVPALAGCDCASETSSLDGISGVVFEDSNGNGARDEGEPGVPDVIVSNGALARPTDKDGEYKLPSEGDFVFITIPRDYVPTESWYRRIAENEFDFALQHAPDKDSSQFTFVQLTDIHLDADHLSGFNELITELNEVSPDFVIATGDLIVEGNTATVAEAEEWFSLYRDAMAQLDMPVFNAVGNHDVVGIKSGDVAETEPGYGEGIFTDLFGPTYYSFDWGEYHCIVLDPNDLVDGEQVYQISEPQMQWLEEDLKFREKSPLLVFYHEPTPSWRNRSEFSGKLGEHRVQAFCGHWHQDIVVPPKRAYAMQPPGIPEQVTGAVCGEWWYGPNPDGRPAGYRLVSVNGEEIDSLYKGTGSDRVIDLDLRNAVYWNWPVITLTPALESANLQVGARILSGHGAVSANCTIDGGTPIAMEITDGEPWATATATCDVASLAEGYHHITLTAVDEAGEFQRELEFKVIRYEATPTGIIEVGSGAVPVEEVYSHFEAYQGYYVTLEGTVSLAFVESQSPVFTVPAGTGGFKISDGEGDANAIVVIAGECFSPPLSQHQDIAGKTVQVTAVPLRLSWDFLTSSTEYTQNYNMVQQVISMLPPDMLEGESTEPVAIRAMRLLSAGDLSVLSWG